MWTRVLMLPCGALIQTGEVKTSSQLAIGHGKSVAWGATPTISAAHVLIRACRTRSSFPQRAVGKTARGVAR
ncbi:hypothetical protein PHLGIDRAFT_404418 [Phlebiopsis gigantea 11061_1 CR5-6]|uniref:Uncharacterized protein n=1 Tax=Phlebiopsis gigantea (strain 11061_1 CR5-6) TaxID=745531 RepID=A0A0C3SBD4_PHLG1|nr:hypothetical protein PHLGIDRAFT_404418 [Phlebiopsis gigantea 11061_1 CR5-6]